MRFFSAVILAALFLPVVAAHATVQTTAAARHAVVAPSNAKAKASGSQYASESAILEDAEYDFYYNDDGTGTLTDHAQIKVQDEAGVKAFSVLSVPYASATQVAKIVSIKVTHPDGTGVVTPASDGIDLTARVTQEAPLYSDLKVLQVPVRGLQPGDTLEFTMRVDTTKAQVPGEFWNSASFLKRMVVLKQTVELNVPAGKYVQVWDPGLKPTATVANGRKVYSWTYSQTKPTQDLDKKNITAANTRPAIAWTTFKSWQAVGAWYKSLAAPRAVPTPVIVAKANQITANAKTPEAQAKAIYDFVATQIRYVEVDFGIGRYQPHAAQVVLANQYGDCKDKDTLLEALLRAKGFQTAPALIGNGIKMIPDLPTPGVFNHVITTVTINGKQIWLDSTPGVAPFQMLVSTLRDKQALVIPENGPAQLERTPSKPPFPLVDRMDVTATLAANGDLKAQMSIDDRSDKELILREVARSVAPAQWDQAMQYLSRLMGFGGTVSNAEFSNVENLDAPIAVTYDYDHPNFGDWSDLRILPLFPSITLPAAPDKEPENAIKMGAERTEIAKTVIHLPAGFTPNLPDAVHVKTPFATYDRTYTFENGAVTVSRTVAVLASKLPAADWKAYKKFVQDTSLFNLAYIQLLTNGTQPAKTSAANGAANGTGSRSGNNEAAAQLVTQADRLEQSGDFPEVLKLLNQAKAIAPEQPYLWSNYGWVSMAQHDLPTAQKDFQRELKYHPDETYVSWLYAKALVADGQRDKAMSVLRSVVKAHATDVSAVTLLAALETKNDLSGAINTFKQATVAMPENSGLVADLAQALIFDHQNDKAAKLLEKQLATEKNQALLNDESYELALTGEDLALAEQKSREAVDMLTAKTSQTQVAGANNAEFARSANLVADWDTLGYILMKEGKLDAAHNYLEAAWSNQPSVALGLHYGMLLEKEGRKADALRTYELSVGQQSRAASEKDKTQLKEAILRLSRMHVPSTVKNQQLVLQNRRTFHLTASSTPKKFELATFRLQFSADAQPQVMQVNGDAGMVQFVKQIQALHFPQFIPSGSKARLLRDAAVSCSPDDRHCLLVLFPLGGMQVENATSAN